SQSLTTLFRSRLFDPELYVATARIRLAQGDVEGAIEARTRAAAIRDRPEDHLALAGLTRQAGEKDRATKACVAAANALFATWPRPLDPLLWEIGACLAQAPDDQVPDEIAGLARKHPLPGNVLLGHFYRVRGEYEPALAAYGAAADARPDEGAPHYFLGETYQSSGQPDRAEAEYRRAAELSPLESLPLLALGRMQWAQGRHEDALGTFREAVEATPGWGEAQVELANALLVAGDREGAAAHYRQALLADRDVTPRLAHDLAAELASAEIESPGAEYVRGTYVTIDGQRQRALFMHPDSRARYAIEVPAGGELAFDVATMPESWNQPGDGVGFAVYVESSAGVRQVFSTTIDPKQRDADRRWHSFVVDLDDYSSQAVTLILETSAGPAGDVTYDWAVWGNLRLLKP
ncbi:MAG: tetratricopeptide repeat protein, partial [Anaerolineae bacterium]|nr:tetratricopeptide repeat protein [Anaerolineae bacterium]